MTLVDPQRVTEIIRAREVQELRDALYAIAMAGSNELEFAARSLSPYDVTRLAMLFEKIELDCA